MAIYDRQLAEEMMTNHGYKELMPGARDGIDLSDRDDPTADEKVLDKIRKEFDESKDGIKLTKLKNQFDKFSKKISDEEAKKRTPKLEEEYDIAELEEEYDIAKQRLIFQLYHYKVNRQSEIPSWEYDPLYEKAAKPLKKALNAMGKEYYYSSLKDGKNILKLEKQFEETKNRLKSHPDFSEAIKVLSEELAKKHRRYIEARLDTEEPNEKSKQALKRIQMHLKKGIKAMKAMEEPLSQGEKEQGPTDKLNSPA